MKQTIKVKESQLIQFVTETVKRVLKEEVWGDNGDAEHERLELE